jgi:hypothetical protein
LQQQKKHEGAEPKVGEEKKDGSDKRANVELQNCSMIMSYTEILTAPPYGVYGEHGEDIF